MSRINEDGVWEMLHKARFTYREFMVAGDWDDAAGGNQVLIHFHPNGLDATYFALDGYDYGGGISAVITTREKLEDKFQDNWELHRYIRKHGENIHKVGVKQ